MRGSQRWLWWGGATAVAAAATVAALLAALKHEPADYLAACQADEAEVQRHSDEVLEQVAHLASSERLERPWSLDLSAAQVNGWLACDLPRNHAYLLPADLSAPRVMLSEGRLRLAGRYRHCGLSTVVQLDLEIELLEPSLLTVRFVNAKAGALPLPLSDALELLRHAAGELDLHVSWRLQEGAPLALIRLPKPAPGRTALALETLSLAEGSLRASGRFERSPELPLARQPSGSPR